MNKRYYTGLILLALSSPAFAGKGGVPSGKPFIQINDQIVEVKSSIATLESQIEEILGKVSSIEGDISAHQQAIDLLRQQDIYLNSLIADNKNSILGLQSEISSLKNRQVQLETAIATFGGDIEELKIELAGVKTNIVTLEEALASVTTLAQSFEQKIAQLESSNASLQSQIDANGDSLGTLADAISSNNLEISRLSSELAALTPLSDIVDANTQRISDYELRLIALEGSLANKQNLLSGTCPDGQVLVGFEDGVLTCKEEVQLPSISCPEGQVLSAIHSDGSSECQEAEIVTNSLKLGCPGSYTLASIDLEAGTGVCKFNQSVTRAHTQARSIITTLDSHAYRTFFASCPAGQIMVPLALRDNDNLEIRNRVLSTDSYGNTRSAIGIINRNPYTRGIQLTYSCSFFSQAQYSYTAAAE